MPSAYCSKALVGRPMVWLPWLPAQAGRKMPSRADVCMSSSEMRILSSIFAQVRLRQVAHDLRESRERCQHSNPGSKSAESVHSRVALVHTLQHALAALPAKQLVHMRRALLHAPAEVEDLCCPLAEDVPLASKHHAVLALLRGLPHLLAKADALVLGVALKNSAAGCCLWGQFILDGGDIVGQLHLVVQAAQRHICNQERRTANRDPQQPGGAQVQRHRRPLGPRPENGLQTPGGGPNHQTQQRDPEVPLHVEQLGLLPALHEAALARGLQLVRSHLLTAEA
mmetsp:Transcript_120179/g.285560  ORF Transcript_120179/g.285560 Transcript_120179/m.285560 type:complete len:283 (+) Transcript_120179:46-894(+)